MRLPLTIQIAFTHLRAKPRQTLIAMLGVTFGISMYIAMISMMTGLNDFTEQMTMAISPDIRIYNDKTEPEPPLIDRINPEGIRLLHHPRPRQENPRIRNARQIADIIRARPEVKGVSAQVASQAFYNYGPVQLNGSILGVDVLQEDKLYHIRDQMQEGKIEDLIAYPDAVIMGAGLAKKLQVKKGDRVTVTTPEGITLTLKICGVYKTGIGLVDNVRAYASTETVQKMLGKDASFLTDIHIKLKDNTQAVALAHSLQALYGYKAEDWQTANATYLTGVRIRNIMTWSVSITLLIVAGFGIYNIMSMTIMNKMKDIAILKAMGFSDGDVLRIFLAESLSLGFLGSLGGLLFGFILSLLLAQVPLDGGEFFSLDSLPVRFDIRFYFTGIVFGLITPALAGYLPALKAGNMDPIEILRN